MRSPRVAVIQVFASLFQAQPTHGQAQGLNPHVQKLHRQNSCQEPRIKALSSFSSLYVGGSRLTTKTAPQSNNQEVLRCCLIIQPIKNMNR
jgi:hypothetical protein